MKYEILENIKSPNDIKSMSFDKLAILADEIRAKMIETVSKNGGHLASNLGAVELTIAMHLVFNSPDDQIVFDVGHQCYTHKLLTGRYAQFDTIRTKGGLSGFCRPNESEHDIFFSGHSGTSVSAGLGLAEAKKINNDNHCVISVIGDGSFTGGMVYEALNNGGRSGTKHIIILNDNKMSISENVGAFAKYLAIIRSRPEYYNLKATTEQRINTIPGIGKRLTQKLYDIKTDIKNRIYSQSTFFEDLGYRYMGPIDGHDIELLANALETAKNIDVPVLLHVNTVKGKGYDFAEKSPSIFHGISKFDINTGEPVHSGESFSSKFGEYLCDHAVKDDSICAITAAMGLGTGLEKFRREHPSRFFDVGIAEEHAVTFASGLAKNGLRPVFAVYSTFLQRCYDQIVHDVSLQKLKIIFAIDRAGFVGEDGETHNGLMDVPFLNTIPEIVIYSPCGFRSLCADINNAFYADKYSVAIRYPRGSESELVNKLNFGQIEFATYGDTESDTVIVTYGRITSNAVEAVDRLNENGRKIMLLSLNKIKPIPKEAIEIIKVKKHVYFFEEGLKSGGVGEKLALILLEKGFKGEYHLTAVEDKFVSQATVSELLQEYKLDTQGMVDIIGE
ncbi:MAG: 1-deoxy-D-xylulose-5-phosphate synthase [Faecalibacterium sp.]|nr:1-deoxy-D-xylulose-5-phosphate synthase [Ruminococcus sp.]MCM1392722.1 1-deoxy-D-xylulose-5-phosphate synthase [Ruminococcus sp.]MCM1485192.1 1-deoxy-D-xylulose-5-phosphate synthase [Faecalibacterium sp.]